MKGDTLASIITVLVAIIGVAIVAVLVSNGSNTANVLTAGGNAFANILKTAVSPAVGSSFGLPSLNALPPSGGGTGGGG